jgi:hypothetical protein
MPDSMQKATAFLAATRNLDWGWPYLPMGESSPEPTCFAVLALSHLEAGTTRWLMSSACNLGGPPSLVWTKALALFTLARLGEKQAARDPIAQSLLASESKQIAPDPKNELNGSLRGWSWVDGTFSWVEPTSYALLALKSHGTRNHPRIQEAERLLVDRVCADGGWNYGNRKVRGVAFTSLMPTTALAAMALQGSGNESLIHRALDLLDREVPPRPSSLSCALAILCFDMYGRPSEHLRALLLKRQKTDGSWRGQTHLTALAILALRTREQSNVFKL